MRILREWLARLGKRPSPEAAAAGPAPPAAEAATLRRLLGGHCIMCAGDLAGHQYTMFASAVLGGPDPAPAEPFFRALEEQRWQDAAAFQEWEGARDNAEAFAIRCPAGGSAVLVMHDPYELDHGATALSYKVLTPESGRALAEVAEGRRWQPL